MNEVLSLQTEPNNRRHHPANIIALSLLSLSLTGCLASGSSTEASTDSSVSNPTSSAAPSVEPAPTETLPETNTPIVPVPSTSSEANGAEGVLGCEPYFDITKYANHEYEVCTAYVVNSAEIALQGFYKFGNNQVSYLSDAARHHFETRYWGDARQALESDVDGWPKVSNLTGNRVDMKVAVLSLISDLEADRAVLQTQESLLITDDSGVVLTDKPPEARDITMCRGALPGHPLHEWFVVSYSSQPDFDCRGFDTANGLRP